MKQVQSETQQAEQSETEQMKKKQTESDDQKMNRVMCPVMCLVLLWVIAT